MNDSKWTALDIRKDVWRKTRRLKKDKVLKTKEIWNDSNNKLDCPNLFSSFMQSNKSNKWFYLPPASLRISLDSLNPSNSYFQGPPNQSLLFHLPKKGQGNASPKKVGTNKAVSTGEEKKTSLPPEPDRSVAYGNFVPWIFAWYESGVTGSHFVKGQVGAALHKEQNLIPSKQNEQEEKPTNLSGSCLFCFLAFSIGHHQTTGLHLCRRESMSEPFEKVKRMFSGLMSCVKNWKCPNEFENPLLAFFWLSPNSTDLFSTTFSHQQSLHKQRVRVDHRADPGRKQTGLTRREWTERSRILKGWWPYWRNTDGYKARKMM